MNELTIKGTKEFFGKEIPVIEGGFGEGQKVVLAKTVAEIHNIKLKEVNKLINNNIDEFEYNIDIIDLKANGDCQETLLNLGFSKRDITISKNIYLLSEQGYIKFYSLLRKKNDAILKGFSENYFNSNNRVVCFAQNKEIRFREMLADTLAPMNIVCEFQYVVLNYRIDIYIPLLNIAIEYDESNHKYYSYEEQELRQMNIEKELGCRFIRLSDEYSHSYNIGLVIKEIFGLKVA